MSNIFCIGEINDEGDIHTYYYVNEVNVIKVYAMGKLSDSGWHQTSWQMRYDRKTYSFAERGLAEEMICELLSGKIGRRYES